MGKIKEYTCVICGNISNGNVYKKRKADIYYCKSCFVIESKGHSNSWVNYGHRYIEKSNKIFHEVTREQVEKAYYLYSLALNTRKIVKPEKCENCGKEVYELEGHHHDYDKPLDVIFLCRKCHTKTHKEDIGFYLYRRENA